MVPRVDKISGVPGSTDSLELKERALHARVASLDRLLVAYSGGTDSAFLAWVTHEVLGENMLTVLADSPSLPRRELKLAIEFAEHWVFRST